MKDFEEMKMTVEDYEHLYDLICKLVSDCDGFGLFDQIGEEEVQKCEWLELIIECINDVPLDRLEHVQHFTNPANKAELDLYVKMLNGARQVPNK